jgi:dTDP-4-dehydrorhamnose 3,5-epimerase
MHFQLGMAKLVRCPRGAIFDVLVDVRRDSPSFGQWEGFELNDSNHHQLYCPDGFAHGFCVLSEDADVVFAFDDPEVAIEWPAGLELIASARDSGAPRLNEIAGSLPSVDRASATDGRSSR